MSLKVVIPTPLRKHTAGAEIVEVDAATHKWWALKREVNNHQTGHSTSLTFENLDTKKPVGDDYFTTRYLEREK